MVNILVIGDSCTDRFVYGFVNRLAPEAPIPILKVDCIKENFGMAGNVKRNLEALGVTVDLITNNEAILKTRYVEETLNYSLLRVDNEVPIQSLTENDLENINWKIYDAIIISDYNKGFLDEEIIKEICTKHNLVFLDTKKKLGDWCKEATFIKINHSEFKNNVDKDIYKEIKNNLIITLGSEGCKFNNVIYPVEEVQIRDIAGAGDTFLAGLVYQYLETKDIIKAIQFAQECATKVVTKRGVATI